MVKITNVNVYDLRESVIACRNAFRTEQVEYTDEEFEQSLPRAIQLANTPSGSGHSNFLKGIRVSFDIKYPNYFSPELQRYNFFDIVSSSSKMHKLKNMDMDACFNEYVTEQSKQQMKELLAQYNKDKSYESFMRLLSNCPQGIELFMRCSTNYLQLRTIYKQRKTHRLIEDWQEGFCQDFIKKLPYFNEFISGNYGK
jgi:hypothetical protein